MKIIRFSILVVLALFVSIQGLFAQCAICSAVAQSSVNAGESVASGLNHGILYLVGFPYILMALVGYLIYKYIKKVDAEQK